MSLPLRDTARLEVTGSELNKRKIRLNSLYTETGLRNRQNFEVGEGHRKVVTTSVTWRTVEFEGGLQP